jgi:hypothetical protein
VASPADAVDAAEHGNAALVVELGPGGVQYGDVAASCRRAKPLDGQEGDCRLAGCVVAQLEGTGRVGLDAVLGQPDVCLSVGEQSVRNVRGWGDELEFARCDQPLDRVTAAFSSSRGCPVPTGKDGEFSDEVRFVLVDEHGEERPPFYFGDEAVAGAVPLFEASDRGLDRQPDLPFRVFGGVIDYVPIGVPEDEDVDVVGSPSRVTCVPGSPGTKEDNGARTLDCGEPAGDDSRRPESGQEQLLQRIEQRMVGVRPDKAGRTDATDRNDPGLFSPIDLALCRGEAGASPLGQVGQGVLGVGFRQQSCQDPTLRVGPKNGGQ